MRLLLLIPAWGWLLLSAAWFAAGEYWSKKWGMQPGWPITALVVIAYVFCTLAWLPVLLHKNQIALMGTAWLLLATMATVTVGVLIFHEQLNTLQWIGVGLALVALIILGT